MTPSPRTEAAVILAVRDARVAGELHGELSGAGWRVLPVLERSEIVRIAHSGVADVLVLEPWPTVEDAMALCDEVAACESPVTVLLLGADAAAACARPALRAVARTAPVAAPDAAPPGVIAGA